MPVAPTGAYPGRIGSSARIPDLRGLVSTGTNAAETLQGTIPGIHEALGGADSIRGTSGCFGNDRINGGEGNDSLRGGGVADDLDGQGGNDLLILESVGPREDTTGVVFIIPPPPGHDIVRSTLQGGSGADTLVSRGGPDLLDGGDGTDLVILRYEGHSVLSLGFALANGDIQIGNGGLLRGIERIDALGGSADDALRGTANADTLDGGGGNDQVWGQDGNDLLIGGIGNDRRFGGDGADTLDAGPGANVLRGGAGSDRLISTSALDLLLDGGAGLDRLTFERRGNTTGFVFLPIADGAAFVAAGATISGIEIFETTLGGAGDDLLGGDAGANSLSGGSGNGLVDGEDGPDTPVGTAAATLRGGAGEDELRGGGPGALLLGGVGNDTLLVAAGSVARGEDGNDVLIGSSGAEGLRGTSGYVGNDCLNGGQGLGGGGGLLNDLDGQDDKGRLTSKRGVQHADTPASQRGTSTLACEGRPRGLRPARPGSTHRRMPFGPWSMSPLASPRSDAFVHNGD